MSFPTIFSAMVDEYIEKTIIAKNKAMISNIPPKTGDISHVKGINRIESTIIRISNNNCNTIHSVCFVIRYVFIYVRIDINTF